MKHILNSVKSRDSVKETRILTLKKRKIKDYDRQKSLAERKYYCRIYVTDSINTSLVRACLTAV